MQESVTFCRTKMRMRKRLSLLLSLVALTLPIPWAGEAADDHNPADVLRAVSAPVQAGQMIRFECTGGDPRMGTAYTTDMLSLTVTDPDGVVSQSFMEAGAGHHGQYVAVRAVDGKVTHVNNPGGWWSYLGSNVVSMRAVSSGVVRAAYAIWGQHRLECTLSVGSATLPAHHVDGARATHALLTDFHGVAAGATAAAAGAGTFERRVDGFVTVFSILDAGTMQVTAADGESVSYAGDSLWFGHNGPSSGKWAFSLAGARVFGSPVLWMIDVPDP